mmetsp:Transcript_8831/g.13992  ORF Transcript_8831/g.13992 Transcript_8831/m.13992 type:complete len:250 (+) Transcript_8831:330-1079(+)
MLVANSKPIRLSSLTHQGSKGDEEPEAAAAAEATGEGAERPGDQGDEGPLETEPQDAEGTEGAERPEGAENVEGARGASVAEQPGELEQPGQPGQPGVEEDPGVSRMPEVPGDAEGAGAEESGVSQPQDPSASQAQASSATQPSEPSPSPATDPEITTKLADVETRMIKSQRQEYECMICLQMTASGISLPCLHGPFCEACLSVWSRHNRSCPCCRKATGYDDTDCWVHLEEPDLAEIVEALYLFIRRM